MQCLRLVIGGSCYGCPHRSGNGNARSNGNSRRGRPNRAPPKQARCAAPSASSCPALIRLAASRPHIASSSAITSNISISRCKLIFATTRAMSWPHFYHAGCNKLQKRFANWRTRHLETRGKFGFIQRGARRKDPGRDVFLDGFAKLIGASELVRHDRPFTVAVGRSTSRPDSTRKR